MKEKILLLEDDLYLCEGICELLTKENYDVYTASNCADCIKLYENAKYSLIILDIMLPDGSGIDVCGYIRKTDNITPILFLTACDEEFQVVRGLDAGADDYITKPFRLLEFLSRVRALMRRKNFHSNYKTDGLLIDFTNMTVKKDGETVFLTPTEFQILVLLIKNCNQTITRTFILDRIWDSDGNFIDDNTLSVHISRLRNKISQKHIVTVRGIGYRWEE